MVWDARTSVNYIDIYNDTPGGGTIRWRLFRPSAGFAAKMVQKFADFLGKESFHFKEEARIFTMLQETMPKGFPYAAEYKLNRYFSKDGDDYFVPVLLDVFPFEGVLLEV